MRFLVIGLGSMGKRRVRNLLANGVPAEAIRGLDVRPDRAAEARERYGVRAEVLPAAPPDLSDVEAVLVSTWPDQHLRFARLAAEQGKHVFVEAGVEEAGVEGLMTTLAARGAVGFPSCTMRFFPGPRRIKALLGEGAIGPAYCWQYQSGQWLPDWHPWESIHDYYVSKRETGACREIVPFELAWLTELFGRVQEVDCLKGHLSPLDADIDDVYSLQLRHEGGTLGQLLVDVLARSAVRSLRVIGRDGTIEWDHPARRLRVFRAATRAWEEEDLGGGTVEQGYLHAEEPYVAEVACFLRCIRGGERPPFGFADYLETIRVLLRAERSALGQGRQ